jgi:hypothetical protein
MDMVFLGKLRGNQDILFASWEPEQNENILTKLRLIRVPTKPLHVFEFMIIVWENTVDCILHLVKRLRVYTVK